MGELLRIRRDKLKVLQDEGRDPFTITRFDCDPPHTGYQG